MGDETEWFILCYAQKNTFLPLLIKRIGTTLLDHAPGRADRFPIIKSGFGHTLSATVPCAYIVKIGPYMS